MLGFPFVRRYAEAQGVPSEKFVDCYPVVNVQAFFNRSPNGTGVMNTGPAIPKKKMDSFLELAKLTSGGISLCTRWGI
ncbi:MAG: hypothetical protein HRU31_17740 [Rhodobacteraceae bacterium]|nr:hypothetical protein [Paracoccaceae bacterium]